MRVNYAIVFVSDMQRSVAFYRDVCELPLKFDSPQWSEFATEGATLALHASEAPKAADEDPDKVPPGRCRPGLCVPDLDMFHARMLEQNVTCTQQPKDLFGARIAQYLDPDGLAISVSEERTGSQLLRSAPYFPVADVTRSAAYYEKVFGFRSEYSAGDPPEFAIASRDGLSIMFRRVPAPEKIVPNEKQGGSWDAFFWVRDARALHAELAANGAVVVYGPMVQQAYQMLEFAVRDPEGYVLGFGEPLGRS